MGEKVSEELKERYAEGVIDEQELSERLGEVFEFTVVDTLPTQLWMSREQSGEPVRPRKEKFEPVEGHHLPVKPNGGMWTSTFTPDAEYDSDWLRWSSSEGFYGGTCGWKMEVKDDLAIVEVDGMDDLWSIVEQYEAETYKGRPAQQLREYVIDFEALARDFDGMHLTEEGQVKTRMPGMGAPNLYGWDSECTLWFNWAFEDVEFYKDFYTPEFEY
jgi:hypothetical protein